MRNLIEKGTHMSVMLEPSVRESKNIKQGRSGRGGGGSDIPVCQKKIYPNIPNINGSIVYCIPEIQRK